VRTDDKGEFLIKDLKEGDYTVIIESPGFKRQQIMQIKIKSGTTATMTVSLETQTATVTIGILAADPPMLEPGRVTLQDKVLLRIP